MRKVIIGGSRNINEEYIIDSPMRHFASGGAIKEAYEIISGGAEGVDQSAKEWADRHDCKYTEFGIENEDWMMKGQSAGPQRNQEMAEYASPDGALVAIWDGKSRGTRDMIDRALQEGLEVHVYQK